MTSKNSISIREGHFKDASFIIDAQIAMALETENFKLDFKTVELGVHAALSDFHKGKYYVAESNEKLLACLLTIPEWSDWRNGTVLWIHSLYVVPDKRGQGIYKLMYEHLKEMVNNSTEYRGLRLYVDKTNLPAQKVYHKLGMSAEHYAMFEWMK